MAVLARLYHDDRSAERHPVELDGTIRDGDVPYDVFLDDLSVTGFRMVAPIELAVGAVVRLGVPTLGRRPVRVVRRDGNRHGCEFVTVLTQSELDAARSALPVVPIQISPTSPYIAAQAPTTERKLPIRTRIAVIAGLATLARAAVAAIFWAVVA